MKRRHFLMGSSGAALVASGIAVGTNHATAMPFHTADESDGPVIRTESDKTVVAPLLPAAPSFDGDLDQPGWAEAALLDRFHHCYTLDAVEGSASARVGWRGTDLFVGVRIPQTDREAVISVVLVLNTTPEESTYATVEAPLASSRIVSSRGSWDMDWRPDRTWTRRHAVTVQPEKHDHASGDLVAEFAVPLTMLGIEGEPTGGWRFTIVLLTEMGSRAITAWVPIRYAHYLDAGVGAMGGPMGFHAALVGHDDWGSLRFGAEACDRWIPATHSLRWQGYTTKRLAVTVPANTGTARCRSVLAGRLTASVAWIDPDGERTVVAEDVTVEDSQFVVDFTHPAPVVDGRYRLMIELTGPVGRVTSSELSFDHSDLVDAGIEQVGQQFPAPITQTLTAAPPSPEVADLIALLPAQFGVAHIGYPKDPEERPQFLAWKLAADRQHLIHTSTGDLFPHDDYPEDQQATATNAAGETVTYPYHEDSDGRRYFFTAALWNHQTRYVREAILTLLDPDPLGAARILVRLAEVAGGYVPRTNNEWNTYPYDVASGPPYNFRGGYWSVWTPEELNHFDIVTQAYAVLAATNAFDLLSDELGVDVRALIRQQLLAPAIDYVLSGPVQMHNTDPYVWRQLFAIGVTFGEPDFIHLVLDWMDSFMASQFLHDGFWKEITPAYHAQVVTNIAQLINVFAGYSDPPGYLSPRTGVRIDDLDLNSRYPQLAGQQQIPNVLAWANNRQVPIQDTWAATSRAAESNAGPMTVPGAGLVRLTGPVIADQTQLYVMATAKYGHSHSDPLSLTLHAHGQALLPDIGYTYTKYRRFVGSTIGHNTVLVDGADMNWFGNAKHGGRIERMLITDHHQIVRASYPGAYHSTSVYARETWLVPRPEDGGCHVLDIFRVVGGERHEFLLHGEPDHDAEFSVDVETAPYGEHLLPAGTPVRPPENYQDFGEAGGHYPGYQYIRDVVRADLAEHDAYQLIMTTTDAAGVAMAKLKVTELLGEGDHELFLGRSPSLRTTRAKGAGVAYDNNIEADKYDKPSHVLRREGAGLRSTFVTVVEPYVSDDPVLEVASRQTIDSGVEGAVVVKIIHGVVTDMLLSNPNPATPLVSGNLTLNGESGHVRWIDGGLSMITVAGGTSLVVDEASLTGSQTWHAAVTRTTRRAAGADANALVASGGIPFDPTGKWATVVHPDGSVSTMAITGASTLDGGVTLELGDMDPGFDIADDGSSRQPYYPMKRWSGGTHQVSVVASTVGTFAQEPSETATGTVAGTVHAATGEPLEGVTVHVSGRSAPTTTTAADGTFLLADVPVGEQYLTARLAGYATAVSGSLDLAAGQSATVELSLVDHELPPKLTDVTRYLLPGSPVSVTSSLRGSVYLVPAGTPRDADQIRTAASSGSTTAVTVAGEPVELATTGLPAAPWVVYAVDGHDRVSAASPVLLLARGDRTVEDDGTEVVLTGVWKRVSSDLHSGGGVSYTNEKGGSVTVPFHGTRAVVKAHVNEAGGLAEVFVDDQRVGQLDYYAPEIARQQVMYDTGVLPVGLHTVRVAALAQKSPDNPGSQYQVRFDSADISDS